MAKVIVRHRVSNFETFKQGFLAHAEARKGGGATGHVLIRDESDPNLVTIVLTTKDLARSKAFMANPELHAAMAKSGVEGKPEIWFGNEDDEQTY